MSEPAEDTYEEYVKHHDQLRKQLKDANALLSGACNLGLPMLDQKAYEAVKAMQLERDALTSRVAALERETIERCVQVCKDTLAERETRLGIGGEYWDGYASMAKLIAARLSALALRATEQQQQGKP